MRISKVSEFRERKKGPTAKPRAVHSVDAVAAGSAAHDVHWHLARLEKLMREHETLTVQAGFVLLPHLLRHAAEQARAQILLLGFSQSRPVRG